MQEPIFYDLWCDTYKVHNIKIEYDKSKKIKDQILYEEGHVRLLNVSKSFCDDEYQGVWFLFLVNDDFLKVFKSVDSGFIESVVDDLTSLISHKVFKLVIDVINDSISYKKEVSTESFKFNFNNQQVKCIKVYADDKYLFTNFYTNNVVQRGAYSEHRIFNEFKKADFQCEGEDHTCITNYYKNNSVPNLANTVSFTSTNYSSITYDHLI